MYVSLYSTYIPPLKQKEYILKPKSVQTNFSEFLNKTLPLKQTIKPNQINYLINKNLFINRLKLTNNYPTPKQEFYEKKFYQNEAKISYTQGIVTFYELTKPKTALIIQNNLPKNVALNIYKQNQKAA